MKKEKKKEQYCMFPPDVSAVECHILEALASIKHAAPCGLKRSWVDIKFNEFFSQACMVELQFSIKEQLVVWNVWHAETARCTVWTWRTEYFLPLCAGISAWN